MVTGPRQSGKTTLCRAVFPDLDYVNLERPDTRELATDDPRGFLRRYSGGVVLDEIQRVPELTSYLQVHVDEQQKNGLYVLTGSQQLNVFESISQSLAGRAALLRLLPFSIEELAGLRTRSEHDGSRPHSTVTTTDRLLRSGFYPRIHDHSLDPVQALGDYFETYVERDVRQLKEIRNLTRFQKFVRLCAGRIGQLVNLESLGNDTGVSHTTVREWLSVLEATYIVFMLQPYHANISKRLIKTPKLYFYDPGLASYLLGIEHDRQLDSHPLRGSLFENLVVVEALKHRFNQGKRSNLFFFRDRTGNEVDLIYTLANHLIAIEIKAGETLNRRFFSSFRKLREFLPDQVTGEILVYGGDTQHLHQGVRVTNPLRFVEALTEVEAASQPIRQPADHTS